MTISLSFAWASLDQFASNSISMTLLLWHKVSIYLASLSQRQISYEKSRNDSQGSFSKQVCMNNRWLVWQISRGQASVDETDVLLCDVQDTCRQSKGKMLEIQTFSTYCKSTLRSKIQTHDKTAGLSLNPQKNEHLITVTKNNSVQSRSVCSFLITSNGEKSFDYLFFFACKFHKHMVTAHEWPIYTRYRWEMSNVTFVGGVAVSHDHLDRSRVFQTLHLLKKWQCHMTIWVFHISTFLLKSKS